LLVALIPALLMLATFGLDRLEAGLVDDAVSPADVAAALDRARADCAKPPTARDDDLEDAGDDVDDDVDYEDFEPFSGRFTEYAMSDAGSIVPARIYVHHRTNPEFRPTRHADRV
jgi:hypothetical protein